MCAIRRNYAASYTSTELMGLSIGWELKSTAARPCSVVCSFCGYVVPLCIVIALHCFLPRVHIRDTFRIAQQMSPTHEQ